MKRRGPAMLLRLLVISIASATLAVAQEDPFARLAIPAGELPQECRLAPAPAGQTDIGGVLVRGRAHLPIDRNPWQGADRTTVAEIRARIDYAMVPDGPPPQSRELAAFRRNAADGVAQAYAAVYETAERQQAAVYAVQFESDYSFEAAAKRTKRTTFGDAASRTLVSVSGNAASCVTALRSQLRGRFAR